MLKKPSGKKWLEYHSTKRQQSVLISRFELIDNGWDGVFPVFQEEQKSSPRLRLAEIVEDRNCFSITNTTENKAILLTDLTQSRNFHIKYAPTLSGKRAWETVRKLDKIHRYSAWRPKRRDEHRLCWRKPTSPHRLFHSQFCLFTPRLKIEDEMLRMNVGYDFTENRPTLHLDTLLWLEIEFRVQNLQMKNKFQSHGKNGKKGKNGICLGLFGRNLRGDYFCRADSVEPLWYVKGRELSSWGDRMRLRISLGQRKYCVGVKVWGELEKEGKKVDERLYSRFAIAKKRRKKKRKRGEKLVVDENVKVERGMEIFFYFALSKKGQMLEILDVRSSK